MPGAFYSHPVLDLPFRADVDFDTYQYRFVAAASTVDYVKLATGGSNPMPLGVIQNDPRPGEEANVRILGVAKVEANAPIVYGAYIYAGSTGRAESATSGSVIQGVALGSLASGSGYVPVLLWPQLTVIPAS